MNLINMIRTELPKTPRMRTKTLAKKMGNATIKDDRRETDEQRTIINAPLDQDICINAAPGSGKTTTIIMRIKSMLTRGVKLEEICLFTYNRALADDMKKGIRKAGIDPRNMGFCGTLHALCYRETNSISKLNKWIDLHKDEPSVLPKLKYIIFDEYQDATKDIATVVEMIARDKYLTITGDERQQIYSHNGANSKYLFSLKEYHHYPLTRSFRCNKKVCELLTRLYPSYPPIESDRDGPKPTLLFKKSKYVNNPIITEKIVELVEKHKNQSIAIISPVTHSNKMGKFINDIQSNLLKKCDIPFATNGEGRYVISTVHGVKGKEFDVTILLNTIWTNYTYDVDTNSTCKLFVALSRVRGKMYVIENVFGSSKSVGTLPFINSNLYLFNHEKWWMHESIERQEMEANREEKWITQYIRSIDLANTNYVLEGYDECELLDRDEGIGDHFTNPILSGELIEILLAIKIFAEVPSIPLSFFITKDMWDNMINDGVIKTVIGHIKYIFDNHIDRVAFDVFDNVLNLTEMRQKKIKMNGVKNVTFYSKDRVVVIVSGSEVVSNLMFDEYRRNVDEAKRLKRELTPEVTEENIRRVWWIIRFNRLTNLSLVEFETPDMTARAMNAILFYLENEECLSDLKPNGYQIDVSGLYRDLNGDVELCGKIDFETEDSIVEVKCFKDDCMITESESPWIQAALYNCLSQDMDSEFVQVNGVNSGKVRGVKDNRVHKYDRIYVYNPITGSLFERVWKGME